MGDRTRRGSPTCQMGNSILSFIFFVCFVTLDGDETEHVPPFVLCMVVTPLSDGELYIAVSLLSIS